jgi:hypothetical protein
MCTGLHNCKMPYPYAVMDIPSISLDELHLLNEILVARISELLEGPQRTDLTTLREKLMLMITALRSTEPKSSVQPQAPDESSGFQ